ncbi:MAG TPA: ABC transporter permease subunit [Phycisphaerales bacterium]|nr:ABC transporter permease subunit [Phycisphaerales bacterium]
MTAAPVQSAAPLTEPGFTPGRPPRLWRLKRFLRSLNPARLLFGPVFQRDMRTSGRRKGTYAARLLVLLVPSIVVALVFAANSSRSSFTGSSTAARMQALQDTASAVAFTIAWCQLITLTFIAPLLTAGSIVEERTARALSVIAASPLSPGRVIGGLFASRMVHLSLLALLPLPLILAIRTFGGLETSFILWTSAVAVCSAVAMASVGLWASTLAARPAAAISFSLLALVLHWAGPPLIVLCDSALQGWTQPAFFDVMVASPPLILVLFMDAPPFLGLRIEQAAAVNCLISLGIAAGALLAARWQLARLIATDRVELVRQPSRRQRRKAQLAASANAETQAPGLAAGSSGEPVSLEAPPTSPGPLGGDAESRTVTGNPVMWRELRQPLFASPAKRWIGVISVLLIIAVIHISTLRVYGSDLEPVAIIPACAALALLMLAAAAIPAGSVTTELEARTWATLLTTPLSCYRILVPKVLGSFRRLWPPFAFAIGHLLLCIARGFVHPGALVFTLLHFATYALFLCCTGVLLSLCCRKSAVASTLNIMVAIVLWLLGPMFVGLVLALFDSNPGDEFGFLLFSHPMITYGVGMAGLSDDSSRYYMGPLNLTPVPFFCLWAVSLAIYLAAARLVLAYAKLNFHRLSTARV